MTELERVAAALISQWRGEGGGDAEPIGVGALLDRVLPYRVARRILGIDVNEDYEALMLRLLAEEEQLVHVTPADAAELAKATSGARLPDLGVLQLLRSASITLDAAVLARLAGAAPSVPAAGSKWAAEPVAVPADPSGATCWSCVEALPRGRQVKFCPFCGADQRQPACAACGAQAERGWKHCPDCGGPL
jgi:hypothetical protein